MPPFDSNGTYSLPGAYLAVSGATITTPTHNTPLEDISAALTACVKRNGAGAMTGTLTLSGDPTSALHAATKQYVDAATAGKQTVWIPAGSMIGRTTSGAAAGTSESTTNRIMRRTLDFDQSTDEFAQFQIAMPKSWNEGTVTAQFVWECGVTGNVVWGLQAVAISDDDVIDAAFGTAATVTDGVTATTDVMISAETAAITIAGTPAENDLVVFQVYRDADSGSDTAAGDAKLLGVRLFYTTNANTDT